MPFVIHVTTGDDAMSEQKYAMERYAEAHGHIIVMAVHEDQEAALSCARTLGAHEIVTTAPGKSPHAVEVEAPPADDIPAFKGEPAPKVGPPKATASVPPVVGGLIDGPVPGVPDVDAAVDKAYAEKAGKKGTRRSGPTAKGRRELERLKPVFDELAGQSAKSCAKILTEREIALPSGKPGSWQGVQVTRTRKNLEAIYGKPDESAS